MRDEPADYCKIERALQHFAEDVAADAFAEVKDINAMAEAVWLLLKRHQQSNVVKGKSDLTLFDEERSYSARTDIPRRWRRWTFTECRSGVLEYMERTVVQ